MKIFVPVEELRARENEVSSREIILWTSPTMEPTNNYLEKILIYANDSVVGDYRPTFDKTSCQFINEERNFHPLSTKNLLKKECCIENIHHLSNCLIKTNKHRKEKPYSIKLSDINVKLFKNIFFEQYAIFFTASSCQKVQNTIYLEMCSNSRQNNVANGRKTNVYKKRRKPKNYRNTVSLNTMYEESIKTKLKHCLLNDNKNLSASAIFSTGLEKTPKMFVSQDINNNLDIRNFLREIKRLNSYHHKIMNHNINLNNVQSIIIVNKNKKYLYLQLTPKIKRKLKGKMVPASKIIRINNKKFVNCNILKVKLLSVRWIQRLLKKASEPNLIPSKSSTSINNDTVLSIQEYSFNNIKQLMQKYEDNIKSNYEVFCDESTDKLMKDTYKLLVELQLNAIEQCHQLYFNYFTNKHYWPKIHVVRFTNEIKTNYNVLLALQNKAIEGSVHVNQQIVKVNKFLKSIWDKTRSICQTKSEVMGANQTGIAIPKKYVPTDYMSVTTVYKNPKSSNISSSYIFKPQCSEIQVQTSTVNIKQVIKKVIKVNKCCSPMGLQVCNKKYTQTDISVNKNTSIDFGGKQVQICKRNISLKTNKSYDQVLQKANPQNKMADESETKNNVRLTVSEKNIINKISQIYPKPNIEKHESKNKVMDDKCDIENDESENKVIKDVEEVEKPKSEVEVKVTVEINDGNKNLSEEIQNLNEEIQNLDEDKQSLVEEIQNLDNELKNMNEETPKTVEQPQNMNNEKYNEENYENHEFLAEKTANLKIKMEKLSAMLKEIQNYNPLQENTKPETPKDNSNEKCPRNHEILLNIKNTLQLVKEKFEKNTIILKRASDLKNDFIVSKNMQQLIETDGQARPKFIKVKNGEVQNLSTACAERSVYKTKEAITMNLNTSLQLLKNLNEVTRHIKTNPENAMEKLSEIEESIQFQRRLNPRLKLNKMNLTLTPIKNFIASNKMKVSNNAVRPQGSNLDSNQNIKEVPQKKLRKNKSKKYIIKTDDATPLKPPTKPAPNTLTVQTTRETTIVPKIYRPINSSKDLPEAPKLSDLTLSDVAPLAPEYPRKDDLSHVNVEKTYLYKLLNNSFSEKQLEPLIKCSNVNCASCMNLLSQKKDEKKPERKRDIYKSVKKGPNNTKECFWERMDWNTEVTVQNDHSFDFQQYMNDPNFQKMQDVTVYPVMNIQYDNVTPDITKRPRVPSERNFKKTSIKITTPLAEPVQHQKLAPLTKNMNQNKIQKSIQQAIIKNQEKFKFLQNSPTTPKLSRNQAERAPKIVSSGTITRPKGTKVLPQKKRQDIIHRVRNQSPPDNLFDKKYLAQVKLSGLKTAVQPQPNQDDKILDQISKTVKKSQDEMQRYIELVEQKFIKTFSLPENEKATAYNNLESEIKQVLNLINTTKDKRKQQESPKKTPPVEKEKPTPRVLKKVTKKPSKPGPKKCSTTSVIVLKKPQKITTQTSEMAVFKKKTDKMSQPTVCTDPINFFDSLTAIATKTNSVLPTEPKQSTSILKNNLNLSKSSSSITKKVRFKLDNVKSDSSVTISTDDDDYSTQCEETVSEFSSSDQEISRIMRTRHIDIGIWIDFKFCSNTAYPTSTSKSYYLITYYHQYTLFDLVPENYDLKIFSAKGIDFSKSSNFEFDDLKPSEKDSVSVFIENCEEIIQATKNLELKRNTSPDMLEFLNVITSLSINDFQVMSELYYKHFITYFYVQNKCQTFQIVKYYRPIIYQLSQTQLEINESVRQIEIIAKELEQTVKEIQHNPNILNDNSLTQFELEQISQEIKNTVKEMECNHSEIDKMYHKLEKTVDEIEDMHKNENIKDIIDEIKQTTKELKEENLKESASISELPTEGIPTIFNNSQLILFDKTKSLLKIPNLHVEKRLSEPVFSSDFFRYHLKFPLCKQLVKCSSDLTDRNLNILNYDLRKRYEDVYQTLVLNLQVRGSGKNSKPRRTICKKKYVPPFKNKMQIKEIKVDFEVNANKLTIESSHKVLLIFLYVIVFSLAFLCMTRNYECQ